MPRSLALTPRCVVGCLCVFVWRACTRCGPPAHVSRHLPVHQWDTELEELRDEIVKLEDAIASIATEAMSSWGRGLDLKCERDKVRGYVFRVKKSLDKKVRNIPNVRVCQVLKDGLHFTTEGTNGLKGFGQRLKDAEGAYNDKQVELVRKAVEIAQSYTPVIEAVAATISELDAFNCLAHVASTAPSQYVRPTLHAAGTSDTVLTGARHPVMEFQEAVSFIPNDYHLNRKTGRFHVITGCVCAVWAGPCASVCVCCEAVHGFNPARHCCACQAQHGRQIHVHSAAGHHRRLGPDWRLCAVRRGVSVHRGHHFGPCGRR